MVDNPAGNASRQELLECGQAPPSKNHVGVMLMLHLMDNVGRNVRMVPVLLQLHAGGGKGIVKMRGTDRRPCAMEESDALEASVRTYWWTAWHLRMDPFTHPYWAGADRLMVYDNDAFRSDTWLRQQGDRRVSHWAYGADAFVPVSDRHQVEWTPGVPDLTFHVEGPGQVRVDLRSATPNLRDYGIRLNGKGEHSATGRGIRWLLREGTNRLVAHTRNLFGVDGPGVQAVLEAEGGVV